MKIVSVLVKGGELSS